MSASLILVLGYQTVWAIAESIAVSRARGDISGGAMRFPLMVGGICFLFAVVTTVEAAQRGMGSIEISTTALAIVFGLTGLGFRIAAIRELGPWFRDSIDFVRGQPLVQTGIYRFLKHPAEIGFLLLLAGFLMLAPGIPGVCLLLLLAGLSIFRMSMENRLMAALVAGGDRA